MIRSLRIGGLCTAAVLLAACSGGGGHIVPATTHASQPGTPGTQSTGSSVTITVRIPKRPASKTPSFVSPSVQSMQVQIVPPGTGSKTVTQAIGLTAADPGCTPGLSSTVCSASIPLQAQAQPYTLTVKTYDGPVVNGAVSGTVLSVAQSVSFTVVAHHQNTVTLTLEGVPHTLTITPTLGGEPLLRGSQSTGFALGGLTPEAFSIVAADADGNVIVGPGTPSNYTVNVSGTPAFTVTNPTTDHPTVFTLTPPSKFTTGNATVTVSSTDPVCTQPGAACSATFTASMAQLLAVLGDPYNSGYSAPVLGVGLYLLPYDGGPAALAVRLGLDFPNPNNDGDPDAIAVNSHGDIFVGDQMHDVVLQYSASNYGAPPLTISQRVFSPEALAFDAQDNLFVSDTQFNQVTVYPHDNYLTTSPTVIQNSLDAPQTLLLDPAGDLFVANAYNSTVSEFPAGNYLTATPVIISDGINLPKGMAFDQSGNLYVANYFGNSITEYQAGNYGGAAVNTITQNVSQPLAVAFTPGGDLLVENFNNYYGNVTIYPAGNFSTSTPTVLNAGLTNLLSQSLVLDNSANIYIPQLGAQVVEYPASNYTTGSPIFFQRAVSDPVRLVIIP